MAIFKKPKDRKVRQFGIKSVFIALSLLVREMLMVKLAVLLFMRIDCLMRT